MGWSRLQGTSTYSSGQVASLGYSGNVSANSLLLVSALTDYVTSDAITIVDSLGNSWTTVKAIYYSTQNSALVLFATLNAKGAGADTITPSWPSGCEYSGLIIEEFSGVATSSFTDGSAGQSQDAVTGGTNLITSGTFTPTTNGDLIYAVTLSASQSEPTALSVGTSSAFALGIEASDWWGTSIPNAMTEYFVQAAAAGIAGVFTTDTGTQHIATLAAAFKAAGGASANFFQEGYWWQPSVYR